MESQSGFPPRGTRHQHEGERDAVVDPEPYTPCSLTFKAQNTVTDVAETAIVDHGSHENDITTKGHLQETGQPRKAKLRLWREAGNLRTGGEVTTDGGAGC